LRNEIVDDFQDGDGDGRQPSRRHRPLTTAQNGVDDRLDGVGGAGLQPIRWQIEAANGEVDAFDEAVETELVNKQGHPVLLAAR
jgi:hypothetical protein